MGEARSSRDIAHDLSSGRREVWRSGTKRPKGRTYKQLYEEARHLDASGRSNMNKAQLRRAVDRKKTSR